MRIFFGNLLGTLVLALFIFSGIRLAERFFYKKRFLIRLWLGGIFGLLGFIWLPAFFSFFLGFTLASHLLALAVCLLALLFMKLRGGEKEFLRGLLNADKILLISMGVFLLLCGYLLYTHTLPEKDGALYTGQSTYGDMSMHLGFITSLYKQKTFPPMYSIFPGTAVGYPFLCDSVSSSLMVFGGSLRFSYALPMMMSLGLIFVGLYAFFEALVRKPKYVFLAMALFLLCGGFGFAYFFDNSETNHLLSELMTGFFKTPTNLLEKNVRWVNVICDMLIVQRATLFGWTFCFAALYLLMDLFDNGERKTAAALGIIGGLLPLIHTHSYLALAVISAVTMLLYMAVKGVKKGAQVFWIYAVIAAALSLPQLLGFTFPQSMGDGFLRYEFNWGNLSDNYFWFYIKNIGLVALLLIPAAIHAPKRVLGFSLGAAVLFVICEYFIFQPNPYDNNKLLYISFAYACAMVSILLVDIFERLRDFRGAKALALITLLILFASGTMSIAREVKSSYELFSRDHVLAAEWIDENTSTDAVFLSYQNHNNSIPALTGRSIYLGADSYLYYHGLDTSERKIMVRRMFEEPGYLARKASAEGIDYVYVSDFERYNFDLDEAYFDFTRLVYENDTVTIYALE